MGKTLEYATPVRRPPMSRMAVGAVCLSAGALGLIGFVAAVARHLDWQVILVLMLLGSAIGVAGVISGMIAFRRVHSGKHGGGWVVLLGIVLGLVGIVGGLSLGGAMYSEHRRDTSLAQNAAVRCALNLRVIGLAIHRYADEHEGRLPDSWADLFLMEEFELDAVDFLCPNGLAERACADSREEIAEKLEDPRHSSYVYWGAGLTVDELTRETVLATERNMHHRGGMNVLLGDGGGRFYDEAEAERVIRELELGHNPPRGRE